MLTPAYRTETAKVDAQVLNSNWVRKITGGQVKTAEEEGSAFIRSELRQESFHREIMVPILLGDDELDRDLDTDQPRKIVEKEPNSFATFVPFYGTGPRTIFKGPRYEVRFGKIESQRFRKSKFELMTYQNDIRKILTDNSVKDMAKQEDIKFITTVDDILTAAPTQVVGAAAWNSAAFVSGLQNLKGRKRPMGKMLMTDVCYDEALNLPATAVGNDVASRHYDEGVEKQKTLWGIPVVTTIHNDVVTGHGGSRYSVYFFAPENYLGNLFLLQDATLYIEQKADIIHFHSYEVLGSGIGNTASITRVDIA